MALVATPAVVLHAFDYLESSRVLRLLTRDAGVVSVLARGARRGRSGSVGPGLFSAGDAQISMRPTRELQTLASFDVTAAHAGIGLDLDRFAAASAVAELALRFAAGEANAPLHDAVATTMDDLAVSAGSGAGAVGLRGAWHVVAAAGFAPAVDLCALCHASVDPVLAAPFSGRAGGVLCPRCAPRALGARTLPPTARAALRDWLGDTGTAAPGGAELRAHLRLLREFAAEHLADERALRAFAAWEAACAASDAAVRASS